MGGFSNKWSVSPLSTQSQALTSASYSGEIERSLWNRVRAQKDPRVSVIPILEQWVGEGEPVYKPQLQFLIREIKGFKRFHQALEISKWMTDRRYFSLSPSDVAIELELISRVHGLKHAETYFNSISTKLKSANSYGALLNVYVREKCVAKAEATIQKMKEMGWATTSFPYNVLINLYSQIGEHDKIDLVMQEIDALGIPHDKFTLRNLMNAHVQASDILKMEKILQQVENDLDYLIDWKLYSLAANGYLKVGSTEKALSMLKKMEEKLPTGKIDKALEHLITLYAKTGNKSEVYRVWELYNHSTEVSSALYSTMITSLAKMDDVEGAQKIFQEWESRCRNYDFRVLNQLLGAYGKKGLLDRAVTVVKKASEGRTPYASTWNILAEGYVEHKQMDKAVQMFKKALSVGRHGWTPSSIILDACLEYLEGQGDAAGMEEMIVLLKISGSVSQNIYHRLLRTYISTGKSVSGILQQMKIDGFTVNEETQRILEKKPKL